MSITSTRCNPRSSSPSNAHVGQWPHRDMRKLRLRVSSTVWKAKRGVFQWNFWAQKISHTADSLYNEERSWNAQSPCSVSEASTAVTLTSSTPLHQPALSSTIFSQALVSRSSSTSDQSTPPRAFIHTGHGLHNLCDDLIETSGTIEGDSPDQKHQRTHTTLNDDPTSQQDGASEFSTPMSREYTVDDLIRDIDLIQRGVNEQIYRCKMLIDSGNPHENLISSKVVDDLRLTRSHRRPLIPMRIWYKLTPWTKAALAAKNQATGRVRNIDGTVIDGQDGTVTITWFGHNRSSLHDSILHFQPKRYETTHVVVEADKCSADIILCWREVDRLRLRDKFTGGIREKPTPGSDPDDKKYADYERRKAERAATREASRQAQPGNSQGQRSGSANTKQPGK